MSERGRSRSASSALRGAHRVEQRLDAVFVDASRDTAPDVVPHPVGLPAARLALPEADADRDVASPGQPAGAGGEPRAVDGVPVVRDDQAQVQLGRAQQQRERPGVVNVVADVSVEDHGDAVGGGVRRGRDTRGAKLARPQSAGIVACRPSTGILDEESARATASTAWTPRWPTSRAARSTRFLARHLRPQM